MSDPRAGNLNALDGPANVVFENSRSNSTYEKHGWIMATKYQQNANEI